MGGRSKTCQTMNCCNEELILSKDYIKLYEEQFAATAAQAGKPGTPEQTSTAWKSVEDAMVRPSVGRGRFSGFIPDSHRPGFFQQDAPYNKRNASYNHRIVKPSVDIAMPGD